MKFRWKNEWKKQCQCRRLVLCFCSMGWILFSTVLVPITINQTNYVPVYLQLSFNCNQLISMINIVKSLLIKSPFNIINSLSIVQSSLNSILSLSHKPIGIQISIGKIHRVCIGTWKFDSDWIMNNRLFLLPKTCPISPSKKCFTVKLLVGVQLSLMAKFSECDRGSVGRWGEGGREMRIGSDDNCINMYYESWAKGGWIVCALVS